MLLRIKGRNEPPKKNLAISIKLIEAFFHHSTPLSYCNIHTKKKNIV